MILNISDLYKIMYVLFMEWSLRMMNPDAIRMWISAYCVWSSGLQYWYYVHCIYATGVYKHIWELAVVVIPWCIKHKLSEDTSTSVLCGINRDNCTYIIFVRCIFWHKPVTIATPYKKCMIRWLCAALEASNLHIIQSRF